MRKKKMKETLCWRCKKSTNGGCSWSRSFIPVDGWVATESGNGKNGKSYCVQECPEFLQDDGKIDDLNDTGVMMLGASVLKMAVSDYDGVLKAFTNTEYILRQILTHGSISEEGARKRLERFFVSDYAYGLTDMDSEYLMDKVIEKNGATKELDGYKMGVKDCYTFIQKAMQEHPVCSACQFFTQSKMNRPYGYGWCELKSKNVYPNDCCEGGKR